MNDLTMTVSGWVATAPKQHVGPSGVRMTTFRVASTSRFFDRDKNEWVDGRTEWFSVRCFRGAAITVANSIDKGQPVTVHGRFRTNEWESDTGPRTDLVIDAVSIGHDLTRGTATFVRAVADESLTDGAAEQEATQSGDSSDVVEDAVGGDDSDVAAIAADEPAVA